MTKSTIEMENAGNLPHIAARLLNTPLMLSRPKMEILLSVLGPRLNLDVPRIKSASYSNAGGERDYAVLQGGVAVIPIIGTLVQRGSWLDAASGLTSYGMITDQFAAAMADPDVKHVLLEADSSGGEVHGVFDAAEIIYQARGEKPITAMINEQCFSACYLLASAADRIIIPRTGGAGSIGVIAAHADFSKANEMDGVKVTTVYAGARKNDFNPNEPLSDEALQVLREHVDETYALFVETVARNTGLSTKAVRDTQAGLFYGKSAVKAGLASKVQSYNDTLLELTSQPSTNRSQISMSIPTPKPAAAAKPAIITNAQQDEPTDPPAPAETDAPEVTDAPAGDPPAPVVTDPPADDQPAAPAADPAPDSAASANVIDFNTRLAAARTEGADSVRKLAASITDMCAVGGLPEMSGRLISTCATLEEAQSKLFEEKARRSDVFAVSTAHADPEHTNAAGWDKAFAKASPTRKR